MALIGDPDIELQFLRLAAGNPKYRHHLYNIDSEICSTPENRALAGALRDFTREFRGTPPVPSAFRPYVDERLGPREGSQVLFAYEAMLDLRPDPAAFEYYRTRLMNDRVGRDLLELSNEIQRGIPDGKYRDLHSGALNALLRSSPDTGRIKYRGRLSDTSEERWKRYERAEAGEQEELAIPFGIKFLDKVTGGIFKSTLTLFYAGPGGGKSRTMISTTYNVAEAGYYAMYFSLEMSKDFVMRCFDSRAGMLDAVQLRDGRLSPEDADRYERMLRQKHKILSRIWIVDMVGMDNTIERFLEEMEIFRVEVGRYPDVVFIDYAGLMEPTKERVAGRSEKYDEVFKDIVFLMRSTGVGVVTAMQESRDFTKKGAKFGVHNIGMSHAPGAHSNNVVHLIQSDEDQLSNRLLMVAEKARDGAKFEKDRVCFYPAYNFVGDKEGIVIKGRG